MHYEQETGNCDYVSYERYCEDTEERDNRIKQLEIENENLKQENQDLKQKLIEHKALIEELKKLGEGILLDEK